MLNIALDTHHNAPKTPEREMFKQNHFAQTGQNVTANIDKRFFYCNFFDTESSVYNRSPYPKGEIKMLCFAFKFVPLQRGQGASNKDVSAKLICTLVPE